MFVSISILTVIYLVVLAYLIAVLVRVQQTYRFLMRSLDRVSESARSDIRCGEDWEWRYGIFEAGAEKAWKNVYLFRPLTEWEVFGTERHLHSKAEWLDTKAESAAN